MVRRVIAVYPHCEMLKGAEIALKQQRTDEIDQLISRIIFESEQIKLWAKSNPLGNSANSNPEAQCLKSGAILLNRQLLKSTIALPSQYTSSF